MFAEQNPNVMALAARARRLDERVLGPRQPFDAREVLSLAIGLVSATCVILIASGAIARMIWLLVFAAALGADFWLIARRRRRQAVRDARLLSSVKSPRPELEARW